MGPDARKPVFGVSEKVRLKLVSSATETSKKSQILLVASFDMILSNKQITKALSRLSGCVGWSAPVLFANPPKTAFLASRPICHRCCLTNFRYIFNMKPGLEVINLFSCSSQPSNQKDLV